MQSGKLVSPPFTRLIAIFSGLAMQGGIPSRFFLEIIVLLQDILFGSFQPPKASKSRVHRIGFASITRYKPPTVRIYKTDKITNSEKRILEIMKRCKKPMFPIEMEKKTPWTRNHCNIVMASLVKKGLIRRHKAMFESRMTYVYAYPGIKNGL